MTRVPFVVYVRINPYLCPMKNTNVKVNHLYDELREVMEDTRERLCNAIRTELEGIDGPVKLGVHVPITSVGATLLVTEIDTYNDVDSEFGALLNDGTITSDAMLSTETLLGIYGSLIIEPVAR